MNSRERFHAVMHYLPRDRSPIMDFGFWDETIVVWQEQGLPPDTDPSDFFGADPQWIGAGVNVGLCPQFEYTVLEDHGDTELVRDEEGVLKERGKFMGSIPRQLGHTLTDRESWKREFLPRLDPCNSARYPKDWDQRLQRYLDPARDFPLNIDGGSLYGWIRNWMGVENLSMLVYDDRALFEEMVETVADCIIGSMTPALEAGVKFDYASFWEDMCYRGGPLLSPKVFREVLVPQYQRITSFLRKHGVDVMVLDCDGEITHLLPLWLEGGINCMFPIEVGVWGADPIDFRRRWGRDLLMIGGVSKVTLASTREAISAEVERLAPLVEEGGYIPLPDHRVPPDVSLRNYAYYVEEARRVWGKGLNNMRPVRRVQDSGFGIQDSGVSP